MHSGRAALAINCVLAGAEWAPCLAAQLSRYTSLSLSKMQSAACGHPESRNQLLSAIVPGGTARIMAAASRGVVVVGSVAYVDRQARMASHPATVSGMVVPERAPTYNYQLERTVRHRGPRLAAAPALVAGRSTSR